jgi:hypothetical protein
MKKASGMKLKPIFPVSRKQNSLMGFVRNAFMNYQSISEEQNVLPQPSCHTPLGKFGLPRKEKIPSPYLDRGQRLCKGGKKSDQLLGTTPVGGSQSPSAPHPDLRHR